MNRRERVFSGWEKLWCGVLGLGLMLACGLAVVRFDLAQARDQFESDAAVIEQLLSQRLNSGVAVLTSLAGLYQGSEALSSTELAFISQELLASYPYVASIAYTTWVPDADRGAFEQSMRLRGFPNFRIHDRDARSASHGGERLDTRNHYLPVSFVAPMNPHSVRHLGVDVLATPLLGAVVHDAVYAGTLRAGPEKYFTLGGAGYVLAKAIYAGNVAPVTPAQRLQHVRGAFVLIIDLYQLLQDIEGTQPGIGIVLTQHDGQPNGEGGRELYKVLREADSLPLASWLPEFQVHRAIPMEKGQVHLQLSSAVSRADLRPGLYVVVMAFVGLMVTCIMLALRSRRVAGLAKQASEKAVLSERERAEVTLRSIGDAVITVDPDSRIKYMNAVAQALTGWSVEAARGCHLNEVVHLQHEETGDHIPQSTEACARGQATGKKYRLARPDGTTIVVDRTTSPLRDHDDSTMGAVLVLRDVSKEHELTKQLVYQAGHDALTALPNRQLFEEQLTQTLAQSQRDGTRFGIMCFDLDEFKVINDSLGHSAGDQLLKHVADTLRGCVRQHDMIARLGGDEFAAILTNVHDWRDAAAYAQRILTTLGAACDIDGSEVFTTSSIGIAVFPEDGTDLQSILKNADAACYHAKERGRNNYQFYTDAMNAEATERLQMIKHLRQALAHNELAVHYQPQLDMTSGRVIGVEALVRWHSPELGQVPPNRFIPLAEDTGLIAPIGEWVLRESCMQSRRWRDAGLRPVRMSVNVSPRQFRLHDPTGIAKSVLSETGLDPDALTLEITESAIMDDMQSALNVLHELGAMGIQLAIDDFGTGYSSLGALKRFPLDSLKIDRSFVRDIGSDTDDLEIVSAIIAMAHNLKLKVVAEGVETEEQLELLNDRGCDVLQGYYLSKPLPADEVAAFLDPHFRLDTNRLAPCLPTSANVLRHPRLLGDG